MNILINRTDAIGDTLLTIPLAQLIKRHYPQAKVFFLVSPVAYDLLQGNPYVDGVAIYPKDWPFFKTIKSLKALFKEWKIDHFLYVGGSHWSSMIAWLLRGQIAWRGGLISRWPSFLFLNKGLRQRRSHAHHHEVIYNADLLRPLGIELADEGPEQFDSPLFMEEGESEKALQKLKSSLGGHHLKEKYVVIHPGMTGHTLNWPPLHYFRLVQRFREAFPGKYTYIFSHTAADRPYVNPIKRVITDKEREDIFFFENTYGLRTYMGIIKHASLFVGPSTGPTHIANALGVPVAAIYSPVQVQSSRRWGPYFKAPLQVFSPNVNCPQKLRCIGNECPNYECMAKVDAFDVGDIIIKGGIL